jgi:membrane associated rhomboid family serine protease
MDQVTDARGLASRGEELLLQGKVQEAGAEFSQAAQLDPQLAEAHLGLAEVNLALGAYGIVYVACRRVIDLAPDTADGTLARAILYTLDRRYDAAIMELERVESLDPGRAYAHALRGYCLRRVGRNGDAALAEAKSARLSGNRELAQLFPQVETPAAPAYDGAVPSPFAVAPPQPTAPPQPQASPRPWSDRSQFERRMTQARFATRNTSIVTMTLIGINLVVYVICGLISKDLLTPYTGVLIPETGPQVIVGAPNPIYGFGVLQGLAIQQNPLQAYRLLTSMFLHVNFVHVGLNMWSLYAVGVITERIFGTWKYTLIYFAAGIAGGITQALWSPAVPSLGASGAIFGIFGAFGAFILLRRRQFGPAANSLIGQWLFFLIINVVFSVSVPGIGAADHFGGLAVGFLLGILFVTTAKPRRAL